MSGLLGLCIPVGLAALARGKARDKAGGT